MEGQFIAPELAAQGIDVQPGVGKLQMYEAIVEVKSESHTFDYTGEEYSWHVYTNTQLLSDQHHLEVTFQASRRDAGSTQNYFTCKVYEGVGESRVDVTDRYYFKNTYGYINVNKITITLQADTSEIKYSDLKKPVSEGGYGGRYDPQYYTLTADPEVLELMERLGHRIVSVTQTGETLTGRGDFSDTEIGAVVIEDANGNTVTQNYDIKRLKGEISVTTK